MAEQRAKDIIGLYDRCEQEDRQMFCLYRDTADYVYPLENAIIATRTPGENKMAEVLDTTAIFAADDMASGLASTLTPPGQPFFAVESDDLEANEQDENKQYLQILTEMAHRYMFASNFPMIRDEFLKTWCVFGDAGIGCEPGEVGDDGFVSSLDYSDYLPGHYHYLESPRGIPHTFLEKFEFSARQAFEQWGDDAGQSVLKDYKNEETRENKHEFIHVIRPRKDRNPNRIDVMNMPFEDIYVSVKDQEIVFEGGQPEFKIHISRWEKASKEKRGRGVGVKVLSDVRSLNAIYRDMIECGNRHNNPPVLIKGYLEGDYDNTPGAVNFGQQDTIVEELRPKGNFPVTREIYEMKRDHIQSAFLVDVFNQLINLRGDRRTTLEISERLNEGLRRLSRPVGRLIYEAMDPLIKRTIGILIREMMVPEPPVGLQGRSMKITFLSPLILALRRHQAQGFMEWASFVGEMEVVFPGVKDNIDADQAVRDMGDAFGVKATHKMPVDRRDAIRMERQQAIQRQQAMEEVQVAGDAYAKTVKAPEDGSVAKGLADVAG